MARVSLRTQKLHQALADFYAPGLAAETFVDRAFALTSRLVPFALNSHGRIDRRSGTLTAAFDCTPPGLANSFAAFGRLMGKHAPFRFDPSFNDGKPFSAREFYTRPAFADLDIYQEVYKPMGLADHCFMHVPAGADEIVFVGFLRDGRPFDRAEKDLLHLVQPHLANGRKLAFAVTASEDTPVTPELFAGAGFTPRESDVLYWLTRGKTNEEIAKLLRMRPDSVSRHLQTVYEKMGVEHRVSATIRALDLARRLHAGSLALRGGRVSLIVPTA